MNTVVFADNVNTQLFSILKQLVWRRIQKRLGTVQTHFYIGEMYQVFTHLDPV